MFKRLLRRYASMKEVRAELRRCGHMAERVAQDFDSMTPEEIKAMMAEAAQSLRVIVTDYIDY
jgi:uncharacterized protein (DUF433 family)